MINLTSAFHVPLQTSNEAKFIYTLAVKRFTFSMTFGSVKFRLMFSFTFWVTARHKQWKSHYTEFILYRPTGDVFSFLGINKIKSWWSLTRPHCAIKEWFLLHLDQSHCRWQQNPVPKSTFKDWPLVQQVQFPPFHPFLVGHGHPFHPKTDKADTR